MSNVNSNICFVANYTKTYFFDAIADKLKNTANVYWIVVNVTNFEFLKARYPLANILYLPKNEILNQENELVDDFKLNELIYGDRTLKYNYNLGYTFLSNMQLPVYNFLKDNRIRFLFGEITWAHEVLIHRIAKYKKELNCDYLSMHTIRIPGGRFAFFNNEFSESFLIMEPNYADLPLPENAFELKKPDYLAINDALVKQSISIKGRINRVKKYLTGENLDRNDITLLPKTSKERTLIPLKNELNKELYKQVSTVGYDYLKGKKFILATLHKQPEASIDVTGRYLEDQTANIINLWRILPKDWILLVKEHSNAVGDRPYQWFKKLQEFKNILFANEKLDSYILIDMCEAVYTISGTIAYEAALKHKPALVGINLFFNLPYVKKIDFDVLRKAKNIQEILNQIPDKSINEEHVKRKIFYNSYPGIIGDPLNNPSCMKEENIENVSNAVTKLITA